MAALPPPPLLGWATDYPQAMAKSMYNLDSSPLVQSDKLYATPRTGNVLATALDSLRPTLRRISVIIGSSMKTLLLNCLHTLHRLLLLILLVAFLLPASSPTAAADIVVTIENPELDPSLSSCSQSYWYPLPVDSGYPAYLTLNVADLAFSSNSADWHPVIPQAGYYRVEAYIAGHSSITWCNASKWVIEHDTTDAHYVIHHGYGVTERALSQYPLNNQWLDLGEYYFSAGSSGYVSLADLNNEANYATTVSFSAMRFTFTRASLPIFYLPSISRTEPASNPPGDVGVVQANGFDACYRPSVAEMQTWWNSSPYSFYGLYLGGAHLYSKCATADATWVSAVHQQGWSFVPIWVGPQAPCTTYDFKMSADPAVSYQQGRQEADSASFVASKKGLTGGGVGGTVIYYDLEPYSNVTACRQAVASFMNGWVERLHELGNYAGGYGGSCSSYLTDWSTIAHPPDDVWPAYWYSNNYDPNASVFGMPCLANSLWSSHQRIRQYGGDHSEHWGGVGLGIDNDVADGMVALPPNQALSRTTVSSTPAIEDAGMLSATQGWVVMDDHLYWTDDQGATWQDISPAQLAIAYALADGQTWALSTRNKLGMVLYSSTDRGKAWQEISLNYTQNDWQPIQMHFTSSASGWVVLQKQTSQAFSIAVLMQTYDGGQTWLSTDLPAAGTITYISSTEGWLQDKRSGTFYRTVDGGHSWQPDQNGIQLLSQASYPDNTIASGWQSRSLGWSITTSGTCDGEKTSPGFTCQVETSLWQTLDGGSLWNTLPLPDTLPDS